MDVIQATNTSRYQIQSYEPGQVIINQQPYAHSVLVSAESLVPWRPQRYDELRFEDLQALAELNADVVLLGTGQKLQLLPRDWQAFLLQKRLAIDVMTTAAACRTFHILTSEQRLVYAALLIL